MAFLPINKQVFGSPKLVYVNTGVKPAIAFSVIATNLGNKPVYLQLWRSHLQGNDIWLNNLELKSVQNNLGLGISFPESGSLPPGSPFKLPHKPIIGVNERIFAATFSATDADWETIENWDIDPNWDNPERNYILTSEVNLSLSLLV